MPRAILALPLVLLGLVAAGCAAPCDPIEVPTEVEILLEDEEARTLPILASGATRLAGREVPDAHGRLELRVRVTHPGNDNASRDFRDVEILGLRLALEVDGRALPARLVRVEGTTQGWRESAGAWDGRATHGDRLVAWWVVDKDRVQRLDDLVLPEGASYEATVSFDWRHESCAFRASGRTGQAFDDFAQASVTARTLARGGEPAFELDGARAGFSAAYRVASGHDVRVTAVHARVLLLSSARVGAEGAAGATPPGAGVALDAQATMPGLALATFPAVEAPEGVVTPRDEVLLRSAGPGGRGYATSGLVTGVAGEPALAILLVDVTVDPEDPSVGVHTDSFAHAVRVG